MEELAKRLGVKLYRTCVKDNLNVDEVFAYLGELYLDKCKTALMKAVKSPSNLDQKDTDPRNAEKILAQKSVISIDGPSKQRTGGKKEFCNI